MLNIKFKFLQICFYDQGYNIVELNIYIWKFFDVYVVIFLKFLEINN